MLPQVTAPNRARPRPQQCVAVFDESSAGGGTAGIVLKTFQSAYPHEQIELDRVRLEARRYARAAKKENPHVRCRIEWVKEFLDEGTTVNPLAHLAPTVGAYLRPR